MCWWICPKTGGALLGDRIRMNAINNPRVYMRSLATRQSNLALSKHVNDAINGGEAELERLQQTKAGLLQDLLTGKVRVSV